MKFMTGNELREAYLEFFAKKAGHLRLPSASLIPENDPTLLMIGAGMAPFKPFFYRRFFIKKEKRKGARRKSAVSPFPISLFPGPRQSLPPSWGKVAKASETKLLTDEGNTAYSGRRNLLYGRVYAYAGLSFV